MITYSVSGTLYRASQFDRAEFRKIGLTSGTATKEFSCSVDLSTTPLPTLPILAVTPDITSIQFLFIQVTGGTAKIRLSKNSAPYNNIDLDISGSLVMSGVDLEQVTVLGTPSGSCYIEISGMGI